MLSAAFATSIHWKPSVHRIGKELPIEPDIVVPLALLREFATHEQELLARMAPHISEIGAEIGEALPAVARHLADQRSLAIHRLVMAEREDKVLVKRVEQPESEIVVMVFAMDRIQ